MFCSTVTNGFHKRVGPPVILRIIARNKMDTQACAESQRAGGQCLQEM